MDIEKIFKAVRDEPDQYTLLVVAAAIEEQGYEVTVNEKYVGVQALRFAEENGDLDNLPMRNGVLIHVQKGSERQGFRLHFLDLDAICFTDVDTPPVIYNPEFTTGFYKSGATN
ncbi:MAG: hypothetical protein NTU47_04070 [Ignavibacteriales bacterium]|nr:hypothetical protein [Ignavibacteriales bacterium]